MLIVSDTQRGTRTLGDGLSEATWPQLVAEILDKHTVDVLVDHVLPRQRLRPGWRALDIGSGAGTIALWLADIVAPDGRVTAMDTNPQYIAAHDAIDATCADIRTAGLLSSQYDLIHARLVLTRLPDREQILDRLVAALRPGGVIMLGEWEYTTPDLLLHTPAEGGREAFDAYQRAMLDVAAHGGSDPRWARRAPLAMRNAGLTGIHTVVHNQLWAGGQAGCLLHAANARRLQQRLVEVGAIHDQLLAVQKIMINPATLAYSYPTYTTIGHRQSRPVASVST